MANPPFLKNTLLKRANSVAVNVCLCFTALSPWWQFAQTATRLFQLVNISGASFGSFKWWVTSDGFLH